jgi:hypothetical protein
VAPGQVATFVINGSAPQQPGSYDFQWQMVREMAPGAGWFGDKTSSAPITVAAGAGPVSVLSVSPSNSRLEAGSTTRTLNFTGHGSRAGSIVTSLTLHEDTSKGFGPAIATTTGTSDTLDLNLMLDRPAGVYKYKSMSPTARWTVKCAACALMLTNNRNCSAGLARRVTQRRCRTSC